MIRLRELREKRGLSMKDAADLLNMPYTTCYGEDETRNKVFRSVHRQNACEKLAAYEDTGLEPEDFKRAFNEDAVLKLAGQALNITPDRLRELAQADREGRCVVLPKADRSSYISIADLLSDDLTDWIHDPSVGLYGPNGEEAAIMRCFITALEGMKNG